MASKRTVKDRSSTAPKSSGKTKSSKPASGKAPAGKAAKAPAAKPAAKSAPVKPAAVKPAPGKSAAAAPAKLVKPLPPPALRKPAAAKLTPDNPNADPELGPIPEADLRKIKTGMSKRDYDHYHRLLLEKRAEILGDVASLQTDQRNNTGGNLSNMPLHMADVGSDHYEQEFTLGLVESERKLLHEINEALRRMQRGIYGVCLEKGEPIGKPRLDAKPWAKYCIAVAREMERRGKTG
ncbi:MAG: TraR/DksA family transcriptional regulator [Planctomycetota bacterium]|nr:TraR/DksA family transcriptional regulator [Planctomycetota bacterium]